MALCSLNLNTNVLTCTHMCSVHVYIYSLSIGSPLALTQILQLNKGNDKEGSYWRTCFSWVTFHHHRKKKYQEIFNICCWGRIQQHNSRLKKKFHTKCYFIRKDIIWSLRKQGKKICSSFVLGWSKSAMMYQCEPHGIVFGRKCSYKNKRQSLLYLWLIYTWFVVKKN